MLLVFQQGAVGFQRSFIDRFFAGQFAITYPFVFHDVFLSVAVVLEITNLDTWSV